MQGYVKFVYQNPDLLTDFFQAGLELSTPCPSSDIKGSFLNSVQVDTEQAAL